VRFLAFQKKLDCVKDHWFLFDFVLVSLMILETWVLMIVLTIISSDSETGFLSNLSILRLVRLVKLIRMARLAKLLRAVPELVILLKGILAASRSVVMVFLLWLVIIYFYAMIFRQLTKGDDIGEMYFESVPAAMNTLLLKGILPEIASIVNNVGNANPLLWPIMLSFIVVATLTVANMLIGILVGVVGAVATAEKEGMVVGQLASDMRAVFASGGRDLSSPIAKEDFQQLLVIPACACALKDCGVDVVAMLDIADTIYDVLPPSEDGIPFQDFITLILSMRSTNPATVKDIREHVKSLKVDIYTTMNTMTSKVDAVLKNLQLQGSQMTDMRHLLLDDDEGSETGSIGSKTSPILSMGIVAGLSRRASNARRMSTDSAFSRQAG